MVHTVCRVVVRKDLHFQDKFCVLEKRFDNLSHLFDTNLSCCISTCINRITQAKFIYAETLELQDHATAHLFNYNTL